jgi:glycyl-tRNA synthetase beta chain
MPKRDFLLEIGTEPMPARFIASAVSQLSGHLKSLLLASNVEVDQEPITFATPRRLAVLIEGLEPKSSPVSSREFGPPARLLKDEQGNFTKQAEGFARKFGTTPDRLEVVLVAGKGDVLSVASVKPSRLTKEILSEIVPEALKSIEFPKSLTWEESGFRFGRPIRSIVALYGSALVSIKVAGISASRKVAGLPFHGKPVALAVPSHYRGKLKNLMVLADVEERRQALVKRLEMTAKAAGAALESPEDLIEETVYMTEHPVPVLGSFEQRFLSLPAPLLSLVLKKQLKFFPLSAEKGLLPAFIGVRDGVSEGQAQVRAGYERVLTARLSDAAFFIERDLRTKLREKLPLLGRVAYQKSLGTMESKAARVAELSGWICSAVRQDRPVNEQAVAEIAGLAYADLVTEVVKEFPELQGAMGGFYARQEGLGERVALGLEQFYFPAAARAPLPATEEGAIVSLAGKLDGLCGGFAAGLAPTGSADPFGLRRQATGALRILIEKQLAVDLDAALRQSLCAQPVQLEEERREKVLESLREFIWTRAQSLFEEMGYRVDEIRSIREGAFSSLSRALLRLAAIHAVRQNPEFEPLAAAFKRASNILRQAKVPEGDGLIPERERLREAAELALFDALASLEGRVRGKIEEGGFEEGLRAMVALKPQVDSFFEGVMVMAEDPGLRSQRLALLAKLVRLFKTVADLGEIQAPGTAEEPKNP